MRALSAGTVWASDDSRNNAAPYRRCPSSDARQRAMYADLKIYLPNDVLVKVDRISMQHDLEVRCPLLDRRVIEFGFRVPARAKMRGFRTKHLLRSVAARRLPPELGRLPKHGFSAPVGEWLAGPFASRCRDEVLHPTSAVSTLLDQKLLNRMFTEHLEGRADHWYPLWAAWMLERWHVVAAERSPAAATASSSVPRH